MQTNSFDRETLLKIVPSEEVLYKEYSFQEYVHFCIELEEEITSTEHELRQHYETSQLFRRDIEKWPRSYHDFRKYFFIEMKPLRFLLQGAFQNSEYQEVKFEKNDKSYDAVIKNGHGLIKIEFTSAVDHQLNQLAMEALAQDPVVFVSLNATELPKYQGTKRNRKFLKRDNLIATDVMESWDKHYRLIMEAIQRKSHEKWRGVVLGVVFDDLMPSLGTEYDQEEFIKYVVLPLQRELSPDSWSYFREIYLIGMHGLFIYKLNGGAGGS